MTDSQRKIGKYNVKECELMARDIVVRKDWNPRTQLGNVEELTATIDEVGQVVPVLINNKCELIDGHRRLAAIVAGHGLDAMVRCDCLVQDTTETDEVLLSLATVSDGRRPLTYREIAAACERISDKLSAKKIAAATGFHYQTITRAKKLATAPDALTLLVANELVSETAALAWVRLPDEIKELFDPKECVGMSAGDVKKHAKELAKHENASSDPGLVEEEEVEAPGPKRPSLKDIMEAIGAILHAAPDAGFDLDSKETPDYARVSALAYAAGFHDSPTGSITKKQLATLKLVTKDY